MKATVWLWPIVTLLCGSQFVCTAQREFQEFPDSTMMQDDYMIEKRTKPSLSIVNPLDVLRQRLLLEIARRQMKENTRQVEINRAILKNVGKRVNQNRRSNDNNFFDYIRRENEQKNTSHMNNLNDNTYITPEDNADHAGDDDYQMRYMYRLHKNRFTKK